MTCNTRGTLIPVIGSKAYSVGSSTLRSPLITPRVNQIDILMSGRRMKYEHDDCPQVALDYVGKRGATVGVTKEKRIKYIIHRLLLCALSRRAEHDRDHYGNKRLDLAGPLLGGLFRMLFWKLTRDVRGYVQKCVDNGKDVNLQFAIKAKTIISGLKYSLATGNWDNQMQLEQGLVSQVLNRLTYAFTLSHLRRLNSPIGREGKLAKPRQLSNGARSETLSIINRMRYLKLWVKTKGGLNAFIFKGSDGKAVNCPFGSPSVKPDDLLSAKIQILCPTISGNMCCTKAQFDTLRSQVQQAIPFLVGCPACLRNFLNLFCELTCSPHQSQFINVTDIAQAIEFVGAGATNSKEWFAFIGRKAALNIPGCSCGDYPSAPVCSSFAPTQPHKKGSCSVRIGSLKARCIEVSLPIVYVILASLFLRWGLCIKRGSRIPL
ncbi:RNA polymerase II second largest subunit [Tanacetum coccineum]